MTDTHAAAPLRLHAGELVEVRSEEEILATLDDSGAIASLPFMPEMLAYCGRQFRVHKRADKTCDTINFTGGRRLHDAVHLEGMRCNGLQHGGCQAQCTILWKEAWLKRVDESGGAARRSEGSRVPNRSRVTRERLTELATRSAEPGDDGEVRYRCQATDLLLATTPLPWWDLRQYVRDVWSGNVGMLAVLRALMFRLFQKTLSITAYRLQMSLYNKLQHWRGGTPYPYLKGSLDKTPRATLDLKPGEYVRVKPQMEILETLNRDNRNRGLSFDPEVVRYCGRVHRVRGRVDHLIDERTGKMKKLAGDCIILEDAVCQAEYSNGRLFCPRQLYPFWREIWLERVATPSTEQPDKV